MLGHGSTASRALDGAVLLTCDHSKSVPLKVILNYRYLTVSINWFNTPLSNQYFPNNVASANQVGIEGFSSSTATNLNHSQYCSDQQKLETRFLMRNRVSGISLAPQESKTYAVLEPLLIPHLYWQLLLLLLLPLFSLLRIFSLKSSLLSLCTLCLLRALRILWGQIFCRAENLVFT